MAEECTRRGLPEVVAGCVALLEERPVDPQLVLALGGPPARWVLAAEQVGSGYWLRVWGARGLLWVWDDSATPAIITALDDEAWRVREMAAKVVARHRLDDALSAVAALQADPVARVRSAATRALVELTRAGG